jgi:murein DD-endopeptidase MepM/ murein hydrolase activator NlpD
VADSRNRIFRRFLLLLALGAAVAACLQRLRYHHEVTGVSPPPFDPQWVRLSAYEIAMTPLVARWDMPMGGELGELTYNAQPFLTTRHLGDDLNGIGGYNSDLGDAVYAAADGRVVYVGVPSAGWGKVIILAHRLVLPGSDEVRLLQTLYAHLEESKVDYGAIVRRGQVIGSVGTADGRYLAHLHFEMRRGPFINPSTGYADAPLNRISPERFIRTQRGASEDDRSLPVSGPDASGP